MATTSQDTLGTSPVVEPASQSSGDVYKYDNPLMPYSSPVYYTIMSLYIMYIPLIAVPSVLVIASVILLKKHHTPGNFLLLAMCTADLLIAIIAIPIRVLSDVAVTREAVYSSTTNGLCFVLYMTSDHLDLLGVILLTVLGSDAVLHFSTPLKYMRSASNKKAFACIATVEILNLCLTFSFTAVRFGTKYICPHIDEDEISGYYYEIIISLLSLLLWTCFISGIYLIYKQQSTTSWLLLGFVLFYIPTLVVNLLSMETPKKEFWMHVIRLIRYIGSVIKGPLIFFLKPTFEYTFKYFLSTNPINWNKIEKKYRATSTLSPRRPSRPNPVIFVHVSNGIELEVENKAGSRSGRTSRKSEQSYHASQKNSKGNLSLKSIASLSK